MIKLNSLVVMVFTLLFVINSNAQTKFTDSADVYSYWTKRGIIEIMYAYMEDFPKVTGKSLTEDESYGKSSYKNKYIVQINEDKELPSLENISEFLLNNNWSKLETNLLKPLKVKFENSENLNLDFFNVGSISIDNIKNESQSTRYQNWKSKSQEIINGYQESLNKLSSNSNLEIEASKTDFDESTKVNFKENKPIKTNWFTWYKYVGVLFIGFILGGFFVYYISKKKIYGIISNEIDDYRKKYNEQNKTYIFNYLGLIDILKKRKDDYKNKLSSAKELNTRNQSEDFLKLEHENSELKKHINDLKEKISKFSLSKKINFTDRENESQNIQDDSPDLNKSLDFNEKVKQKLFFSIPNNNGCFNIENSEKTNDGTKFFRVEYYEDEEDGELFYISSDRDRRAIINLESYLKPVCDIENITGANYAERIELLNSGKVHLRTDAWVIDLDNKVKIKLK